jgi:hypothetical protein
MKYLFLLVLIGIVLVARAAYVAVQIKQPEKAEKYGGNPKAVIFAMAAIGACFFIAGSVGISWSNSSSTEPVAQPPESELLTLETKNNSSAAYVMMQDFVKDYIISPASAKFPWMSDSNVKVEKNGVNYFVSGYVDSQNSFGAMIRNNFSGEVEQVDNINWGLHYLDFNDQRAYLDWNWANRSGHGNIGAYYFVEVFKRAVDYYVSKGASEKYLVVETEGNLISISINGIGDYAVKADLNNDGKFVTHIEFAYKYNGTNYQDTMSGKLLRALLNTIEKYYTDDEVNDLLREIYQAKNDVIKSLIGNIYHEQIEGDNFLYFIEVVNK